MTTEMMRPPQGTLCEQCKFNGHANCLATGYFNRVPMCSYCLDGDACPRGRGGIHAPAKVATAAPEAPEKRNTPAFIDDRPLGRKVRGEKAREMIERGMTQTTVVNVTGISRATFQRIKKEVKELVPAVATARHAAADVSLISAVVAASVEAIEEQRERVPKAQESKPELASVLSEKLLGDGYRVLTLADLPGRKYGGVYDEIVDEFMKLQKLEVFTKQYANPQIAHTYKIAIVRIARKRGAKVSQKQDGSTIYVWQV